MAEPALVAKASLRRALCTIGFSLLKFMPIASKAAVNSLCACVACSSGSNIMLPNSPPVRVPVDQAPPAPHSFLQYCLELGLQIYDDRSNSSARLLTRCDP